MSRVLIHHPSLPTTPNPASRRDGFGSGGLDLDGLAAVVGTNGPAFPVGRFLPFRSFPTVLLSLTAPAHRLTLPFDVVGVDGVSSLAFGSAEASCMTRLRKRNAVAEPAMPAVPAATRGGLALSNRQPCVGRW